MLKFYKSDSDYYFALLQADAHSWHVHSECDTMGPVLTFGRMVELHAETPNAKTGPVYLGMQWLTENP